MFSFILYLLKCLKFISVFIFFFLGFVSEKFVLMKYIKKGSIFELQRRMEFSLTWIVQIYFKNFTTNFSTNQWAIVNITRKFMRKIILRKKISYTLYRYYNIIFTAYFFAIFIKNCRNIRKIIKMRFFLLIGVEI